MFDETHEMEFQEEPTTRNVRGSEYGMPVFDRDAILLGTVVYIYEVTDPILAQIAAAFIHAHISPEVTDRLRLAGCLVVDSGLLMGYYYVLYDQIEEVTGDGVFLNCTRSELIQL